MGFDLGFVTLTLEVGGIEGVGIDLGRRIRPFFGLGQDAGKRNGYQRL